MTNAKGLCDRLRGWAKDARVGRKIYAADQDILEAADLIEQQAAEIERLREAYNRLGDSALKTVSELGMKLGQSDSHADALMADVAQANREIERLKSLIVGKTE